MLNCCWNFVDFCFDMKRADENISSVLFDFIEYSIVCQCMRVFEWAIVYVLSRFYFHLSQYYYGNQYEPHNFSTMTIYTLHTYTYICVYKHTIAMELGGKCCHRIETTKKIDFPRSTRADFSYSCCWYFIVLLLYCLLCCCIAIIVCFSHIKHKHIYKYDNALLRWIWKLEGNWISFATYSGFPIDVFSSRKHKLAHMHILTELPYGKQHKSHALEFTTRA